MPFQSIEPRRLYRPIADQIRELIRAGEFLAGSRLPPERDLAKQLGVSRPSVREALIALEVEGQVKIPLMALPSLRAFAVRRHGRSLCEVGINTDIPHCRAVEEGGVTDTFLFKTRFVKNKWRMEKGLLLGINRV